MQQASDGVLTRHQLGHHNAVLCYAVESSCVAGKSADAGQGVRYVLDGVDRLVRVAEIKILLS